MKYFILCTAMLALLTVGASAQNRPEVGLQKAEQLKQSPAGQKGIALIHAINTGSEAFTKDLIGKTFSSTFVEAYGAEKLAKSLPNDIKKEMGSLVLYQVYRKSKLELVYTLKGSKGSWLQLEVHHESNAPYKIKLLNMVMDTPKPEGALSPMNI